MYLQKIIISTLLLFISINTLAKETLVFAVDVVRHGDRTPRFKIPKSSHQWKEGMGQLTARGMQRSFQLGTSFRKKYVYKYHLLPKNYQKDTMLVFSTDKDRTLMSAQAILLGLYPPGTGPFLSDGKPGLPNAYQPIPIHVRPFPARANKEKYKQLIKEYVFSRADWKEKTMRVKNRLKKWNLATGLNIKNIYKLGSLLGDNLYIRQLNQIPAPPGLNKKDVEEIISIGNWGRLTRYHTKKIAVFSGQDILSDIADQFQKAVLQTDLLKYILFSNHDTTIGAIMTLLQNPIYKQPPYSTDLSFELFKTDDKKYLVKINYNGKPVILPGCDNKVCTLERFVKLFGVNNQKNIKN